jgi:hypothetical protein
MIRRPAHPCSSIGHCSHSTRASQGAELAPNRQPHHGQGDTREALRAASLALVSSKPNVTTRARVGHAIHRTFGSSPLSTAVPDGDKARTMCDFSLLVFSRVPSERLCSLPTKVTTAMSGLVARAYSAI